MGLSGKAGIVDKSEICVQKIDCECYIQNISNSNIDTNILKSSLNPVIIDSNCKASHNLDSSNKLVHHIDSGMVRTNFDTNPEKTAYFKRTLSNIREEYKERVLPGVLNLIFNN
jgi:hypothetical protein